MFESTRRRLALWLLPAGEAESVRVADLHALKDTVNQYGFNSFRSGDIGMSVAFNMCEDWVDAILDGDREPLGVKVECRNCGDEDVHRYGTTLVYTECDECTEGDE